MARLTRERDALRRVACELRDIVLARDAFLSLAGHELRNPMATIALSVGHLLYRARRTDTAPTWLVPTLEALEHQTRDFSRRSTLLDVGRLAGGGPTIDRTHGCLGDVVRRVAHDLSAEALRAGCELRLAVAPSVPGLWDLRALEQIITRLISNAVRSGAGRPVEISVVSSGDTATLAVRNQGAGDSGVMGPELWIVRQLVTAHGGEIAIGGAPGVGSFFTATLPRENPDEQL
ncbi:MAG TPA: HAMP domain-containing sensor histidine kinase [Polyangiaceae bacterium]|nr:HAMP domain-containing sensor histidine kinase [Polyangiaceae bacterium]